MKKAIALTLLLNIPFASFAVQDQMMSANVFLKKYEYTNEQEPVVFAEIKKDIRVNKTSKEIALLQKQWGLEETGVYSKEMVDMVKQEQENSGLTPTGIIDPNTFMHIYKNPLIWQKNVVVSAIKEWERVLQEQSNQPEKYQNKFIVVNIPSQTLFAYEKVGDNYELQFESRAVVGTNKTRTPFETIFVTALKYNPTWTPTDNIMKKNLFNRKGEINLSWIQKNKLVAYDKDGNEMLIEDLSLENKPARLIQPAGDRNALGMLKFETNSKSSIYLHDTNHKEVFNYNNRVASNGCVRVESYKDLAAWLTNKNIEHIDKGIAKEKTFFEGITKVPVYTVYSQVWFYSNNPYFFADPYNMKKGISKDVDIIVEKQMQTSLNTSNKEPLNVVQQTNINNIFSSPAIPAPLTTENPIILEQKNGQPNNGVHYEDVHVDKNNVLIRRTIPYGYK